MARSRSRIVGSGDASVWTSIPGSTGRQHAGWSLPRAPRSVRRDRRPPRRRPCRGGTFPQAAVLACGRASG